MPDDHNAPRSPSWLDWPYDWSNLIISTGTRPTAPMGRHTLDMATPFMIIVETRGLITAEIQRTGRTDHHTVDTATRSMTTAETRGVRTATRLTALMEHRALGMEIRCIAISGILPRYRAGGKATGEGQWCSRLIFATCQGPRSYVSMDTASTERRWFSSPEEAKVAGWRRALH
jgi:hypothetical protein